MQLYFLKIRSFEITLIFSKNNNFKVLIYFTSAKIIVSFTSLGMRNRMGVNIAGFSFCRKCHLWGLMYKFISRTTDGKNFFLTIHRPLGRIDVFLVHS